VAKPVDAATIAKEYDIGTDAFVHEMRIEGVESVTWTQDQFVGGRDCENAEKRCAEDPGSQEQYFLDVQ
jgi:hypothetical protein